MELSYKDGEIREFIADRFYEEFHINYSETAVDSWIQDTLTKVKKGETWERDDDGKKTEVEKLQKGRKNKNEL